MRRKANPVPESALLNETRALLINRPRNITLQDVAIGTKLTVDFLVRLTTGNTTDPSVNRVEHLNKWLKENLS